MPKKCPLLNRPCLEHGCEWYIQLRGKNPQGGADIDHWGCSMSWLPILIVENSKLVLQSGAETAELRKLLENAAQGKLRGPDG